MDVDGWLISCRTELGWCSLGMSIESTLKSVDARCLHYIILEAVSGVYHTLGEGLESNTQMFFGGNLVEVHPALPLSHLVNVSFWYPMCIVLLFAIINLSFHLSDHSSNLSMSFWRSLVWFWLLNRRLILVSSSNR